MRAALASLLLGCFLHPADPPPDHHETSASASASGTLFEPGPALSGTWYDANRSGEGLVLQMLPDGAWTAVWFTYPAPGEAGEQAWLLGTSTVTELDTIAFGAVLQPMGARFGEAFDPSDVILAPWGSFEFQAHDCARATLRYVGPAGYGTGERRLTRFSELDEARCSGERRLLANGARALDGLRSRSGTWYVPGRPGEGWLLEEFPDGRTGVYWFTFDEAGRQRWIAGVGRREGARISLDAPFLTRGARFGDAFDAADVVVEPFGSILLEYVDCNALTLDYDALDPTRGAARRGATRLTGVAGLVCIDGTPAPATDATWAMRTPAPGANFSELAAAASGDAIYALGGFGDSRGFRRHVPAQDRWDTLPSMPEGRNHHAAFAWNGFVYYVGGAPDEGTTAGTQGYRFDLTAGTWQPVPELRAMFGSHAAVLNGRAYIGNLDGSLQEFDPRSRRNLRIPASGRVPGRDHSQVLAFLGEIWLLGGREPLTHRVEIFDPVSRRWRDGPSMQFGRSGHAAASVGHRIVVAGGERVDSFPATLVPQAETYTAGDAAWRRAPDLPVPVHGAPGVSLDGRFFVVSGSTRPGRVGTGGNLLAELLLPAE